jgi:hypothetical protein
MVKWAFFDGRPRQLSYEVVPPDNASGPQAFTGEADFGIE